MEDFSDETGDLDLEAYLGKLRRGIERRRSMVASSEDIAGTHESMDGQWGEWMCGECGIFLKEHHHRCGRCGASRI